MTGLRQVDRIIADPELSPERLVHTVEATETLSRTPSASTCSKHSRARKRYSSTEVNLSPII